MTDYPVTRTEVVVRVANRLWRHRNDIVDDVRPEPDPIDYFEAEQIVDEVASWR